MSGTSIPPSSAPSGSNGAQHHAVHDLPRPLLARLQPGSLLRLQLHRPPLLDGDVHLAIVLLGALFVYVWWKHPATDWGDVSQALMYHQVRKYLLRIDERLLVIS